MNGAVHDPHTYKRTPITELLNPVASSTFDHSLPYPTLPYSNGHHYDPSTTYTHHPMPPPPNTFTNGGTAYKLNPASWDGTDYHRQRVDHMPPPGAHSEYYTHSSRAHEEGFSEPSVWPSPSGRLDSLSPHGGSPTRTQSSHSDERTCECSLLRC